MLRRSWPLTGRGLALLLVGLGLFAVVDGFTLAVIEEDRTRFGRVSAGVVVDRLSSTGEDGTRTIGGQGSGATVRTPDFDPYSMTVRWLTTGSPSAFVVDYRYGCAAGSGTCSGRDFVTHEAWSRLRTGMPVNVRRSIGDDSRSRLDDNPQWRLALTRTAVGSVLLIAAALASGRVRFGGAKYVKAPAVVTAIREVRYGDETRWRVTFSYFDMNSEPQESIDEANDPSWRVGESCIAVYRPQAPDVATLQALPTHAGTHAGSA